jgi:hypothetical protein
MAIKGGVEELAIRELVGPEQTEKNRGFGQMKCC